MTQGCNRFWNTLFCLNTYQKFPRYTWRHHAFECRQQRSFTDLHTFVMTLNRPGNTAGRLHCLHAHKQTHDAFHLVLNISINVTKICVNERSLAHTKALKQRRSQRLFAPSVEHCEKQKLSNVTKRWQVLYWEQFNQLEEIKKKKRWIDFIFFFLSQPLPSYTVRGILKMHFLLFYLSLNIR